MEVDHIVVVVEDSLHAMKKKQFAQLDLRATRQPQALNRQGPHAARLSPFQHRRSFEKRWESEKKLMHFFKG